MPSRMRSAKKPPKPEARQNTIFEMKYSPQQRIMVLRYPILSAAIPQGISKAMHRAREMPSHQSDLKNRHSLRLPV